MHTHSPVESTQSTAPSLVLPTPPAEQAGSRQQPAQQLQEAYDLDTFLKERDACGVSLELFVKSHR